MGPLTNIDLTQRILFNLREKGIQEFVICPGARNSPFVVVLDELQKSEGLKVYTFFEERSAAFFALGRIQANVAPVAVITTSGTAVAELLPAVIEAHYESLPLILVTADRPEDYRGTGAPQSIEHIGIFSHYIEKDFDLNCTASSLNFEGCSWERPLHINVCFAEPLIDDEIMGLNWSQFTNSSLSSCLTGPVEQAQLNFSSEDLQQAQIKDAEIFLQTKKIFVVLGPLNQLDIPCVLDFLKNLEAPIYAEALSQLRGHPDLQHLIIRSGESLLQEGLKSNVFDGVLRIGGVPTLRLWRDLEDKFKNVSVLSFSNNRFKGLSRPVIHFGNIKILTELHNFTGTRYLENLWAQDQARLQFLDQLFAEFPLAEPSLMRRLSQIVKNDAIFIGNSLPIREWDFAADFRYSPRRVSGNRGANGIDGQLSTFLGWTAEPIKSAVDTTAMKNEIKNVAQSDSKISSEICSKFTWGVFGDLTTLYDLTAPWAGLQTELGPINLVIVNNFGGQIFKRMFGREAFLNVHKIEFKNWAQMWGWSYKIVRTADDFEFSESLIEESNDENERFDDKESSLSKKTPTRQTVIEVQPSKEQTEGFWRAYQAIWG